MRWIGPTAQAQGVASREFLVPHGEQDVPGMFWSPAGAKERRPLVLIGHGGSQSKSAPGIVATASRLVAEHGFNAAAIDGPIHGSRRDDGGKTGPSVQQQFRDMWDRDTRIDFMVSQWRAALDALVGLDTVDAGSIGWYGISMGTAYGLPLIAAESRIGIAVLGMWGTNYPNSQRLSQDAPAVRCPALFQMKWNDQYFTREGQLELFDRLGSLDKWCKIYMGAHTPVEGVQLDDIVGFLGRGMAR